MLDKRQSNEVFLEAVASFAKASARKFSTLGMCLI